jgi:hypothetical protein
MRVNRIVGMVCGLLLLASSCSWDGSKNLAADPSVQAPLVLPPPARTWPRYPNTWPASCWGRNISGGVMRAAPSFAPAAKRRAIPPAHVVSRLLARFGDRRFVHAIQLGQPPRNRLADVVEAPTKRLWAYVKAPAATGHDPGRQMLAAWEAELLGGALRDDLCAAGGAPLVGWSFGPVTGVISDANSAFMQRFPNPSPRQFRERLALVGRKFGFRVTSLRLLRPRQLAPLVIVETDRDRKDFVADLPAIKLLLDPFRDGAATFEAFFLEARDGDGPFVRIDNVYRGHWMGGQWSWDRCVYPFEHSEPVIAEPCPD